MTVLRGFIAASNAQYRRAGLDEYQMKVERDGRVTVPNRPAKEFKPVPGTGSGARSQAAAGAAPAQAAAPAGDQQRAGDPPLFTSLKPTSKGFALRWEAVPGAERYGVYIDGALVGHVPKPAFDGTVPVGSGGVVQVDAISADGTRTQQTAPMLVQRTSSGLDVSDPRKLAAAAQAAAQAQGAAAAQAQAGAAAQAQAAAGATAAPAPAGATAPGSPAT